MKSMLSTSGISLSTYDQMITECKSGPCHFHLFTWQHLLRALAEFKETNNYTKVKRDRSAKISRRSKRYRDKLLTDPPAASSAAADN